MTLNNTGSASRLPAFLNIVTRAANGPESFDMKNALAKIVPNGQLGPATKCLRTLLRAISAPMPRETGALDVAETLLKPELLMNGLHESNKNLPYIFRASDTGNLASQLMIGLSTTGDSRVVSARLYEPNFRDSATESTELPKSGDAYFVTDLTKQPGFDPESFAARVLAAASPTAVSKKAA